MWPNWTDASRLVVGIDFGETTHTTDARMPRVTSCEFQKCPSVQARICDALVSEQRVSETRSKIETCGCLQYNYPDIFQDFGKCEDSPDCHDLNSSYTRALIVLTMPARTAAAVADVEEPQPMPGLQFNEPLSWRAGRSIPVADLLKRLNALSKEMQDMEQEENERDSFAKVAKELVNPNLLAHKDKGVKALTAACLVDILRLCAPHAPYTEQQLRVRTGVDKQREAQLLIQIIGHIQHDHWSTLASVG